jgi:hypothetical protein
MNDTDQTIPSKLNLDLPADKPQSSRKPILIAGGAGCGLLLCLVLLMSSGLFVGKNLATASEAEATETKAAVTARPTELLEEAAEEANQDTAAAADTGTTSEAEQEAQAGAPTMGPITFALETTAEGEAVESSFAFDEGVTTLHAVFEYANLTPTQVWTQVWYYNGSELLNTSQSWPEDPTGLYDYLIEAGGDPLPAGEWALEFYIDGELLTAGSFTVESQAETAATAEPVATVEPARLYRLAYTKWNGQKHDLYLGDTNGSQEQFIMGRAAGPSWSPDGRYIYFYGEEGVDQQVINGRTYPLPGATNGLVRVTVLPVPASVSQLKLHQGHGWNDGTARSANVSPDGAMIAYDGDRGGGRRIYFLGTAATQQFRYEIIGEQADWAPDSQRIVYRSGRNNQTGIWISNRTDSGHFRITSGGTDSFPAWSPDGETIAFSRDVGGNVDIYTVGIDGSNLKRLTDAPGHDTLPLYLPTGEIVFRSARTGGWAIWKMAGDGSEQVQIIANAPVGPDWSFSKMDVLR